MFFSQLGGVTEVIIPRWVCLLKASLFYYEIWKCEKINEFIKNDGILYHDAITSLITRRNS